MRTLWVFAGNQDGIGVQPEELIHPPENLSEIVSLSLKRVASFQSLEEITPVEISPKNLPPLYSPANDMVQSTRSIDASFPWHVNL